MQDLVKIHDIALEHENGIADMLERISESRIKMFERKDLSILKRVVKQLDDLIYHAEIYKQWLKDLESTENANTAN